MKSTSKSKKTLKASAVRRNTATPRAPLASSATPQQTKTDKAKRAKLLRGCSDIAMSKNILADFKKETNRIGLVGEQRIALLILLCVITRVFQRPVSAVIKGSSSGGKNTVVMKVLKFFPRSAYYELTGTSDNALSYMSVPLKHRFLFISEVAGLQESNGQVLLRNLLSEGYLKKEVTVGKKTETITVEGPTGVILTTTNIKLYHDDETRLFSAEVADTPDQSRAVVMSIAADEVTGDGDTTARPKKKWRALLELVATGSIKVAIPYAESIGRLIPVDATRVRRDIKGVFGLIKAHALLHQFTRTLDDAGKVQATMEDYEAVFAVLNAIMAETNGTAVSQGIRDIVQAVTDIQAAGKRASTTRIAKVLKLHRTNVWRNASAAMEGGYLVSVLNKNKKPTGAYKIGEPLPENCNALPTPNEVAKDWAKSQAKTSPKHRKG